MASIHARSEEIIFHGLVQGVGFRMTAARHARHHELRGWVRNDPHGTVTAIVQGLGNRIEAWLECIEGSLPGHVARIQRRELPGTDEFAAFRILRG
ncbi:MAG: acylphosphatase [Phycisphaerae bacterium]|nr:acylphosphatase [Phycisphaerae bacterium]